MSDTRMSTCYYCALTHEDVECQGLYYCPNPACRGPGVAWFNSKLKSYKSPDGTGYSVDPEEADTMAAAHAYTLNDEPLAVHIRATLAKRADRKVPA